mgnify:CR=1 FL=1
MEDKEILLHAEGLKKYFTVSRGLLSHHVEGIVKAVDGITLDIFKGETLGLIGESGCGKSTLSNMLIGLSEPTEGKIYINGHELDRSYLKEYRKIATMVFQDPYSSIDPRMCMRRIIEEPLRIHTKMTRAEKSAVVIPLIEKLGFKEEDLTKYPHEFSGGQRQRIGIARAFVINPEFVICDEPVSALDVSIQAQILNLFKELQRERNTTYLFISHDMSVIKHVSDRIAVMYLGSIVELAEKQDLFDNTLHPYTQALINAIPIPNPMIKSEMKTLEGELPSPLNPPSGCPFRLRCDKAMKCCEIRKPELKEVENGHFVACHRYNEED